MAALKARDNVNVLSSRTINNVKPVARQLGPPSHNLVIFNLSFLFVVEHVGNRSLISCYSEFPSGKIVPPVTNCLNDSLGFFFDGGMANLRTM